MQKDKTKEWYEACIRAQACRILELEKKVRELEWKVGAQKGEK